MSNKITNCAIRMYKMGTGDCFVLTFRDESDQPQFQLMIDCGVYNIKGSAMRPFAEDILKHTGGELDALLITHEHQDHVLGFQRAEDILTDKHNGLKVKELWLPWTEDESDPLVREWKEAYGKKKNALEMASRMLARRSKEDKFEAIYNVGPIGADALETRRKVADHLLELSHLNTETLTMNDDGEMVLGADKIYAGGLKGMEIIKNKLAKERIRYLETGSIIENIEGLENIRIYVLGPPKKWRDVKKEHGKEGETYKHNKELELVRGFSSLPFEEDLVNNSPFDSRHIAQFAYQKEMKPHEKEGVSAAREVRKAYEVDENTFRRIDYDWLMSAANLSLRLTRGINNLSAVLAIEFIDSGKVMLFPGDAEYGSWRTWDEIEWDEAGRDGESHLTVDLLRRTVFYKVAHHLSHNGTAREEGLERMVDRELVAMATLDYDVISPTWQNTMPNRALLRDLLRKTNGRLMLSNLKDLYVDKDKKQPLADEIEHRLANLSTEKRKDYLDRKNENSLFVEYILDGKGRSCNS